MKNHDGNTALHIAVIHKLNKIIKKIILKIINDNKKINSVINKRKINVLYMNNDRKTPLDLN
jgi:ankyrin repeat protein